MAVKVFRLVNGVDANGWQSLVEANQVAADCAAGWVVGTGATLHSELFANTERASTTFTGTTVPDGSLDTTNKDAMRTPALSGTFPAGNWTFQFAMRSPVQGGAADGRVRFRLFKANADGSGATEITAAQQQATIATNVGSAADVNSSLTLNPGAITLDNQCLFIQIAWERTGAGGMSTTNIRFRTGSTTSVGTVITSTDFSAVISGSLASTLDALTAAATGVIAIAASAAITLGALTNAAQATVVIAGLSAPTLEAVTLSAAGTVESAGAVGELGVTLDTLSAAGAGTIDVAGVASPTLDGLIATATATAAVDATSSQTLGAATSNSAGTVDINGTAGSTLGLITPSATGTVDIAGTSSPTLDPVIAASQGTSETAGTSASTLGALTVQAEGIVGDVPVEGALASTLEAVSLVSLGETNVLGTAARTLDSLMPAATATVLSAGTSAVTFNPVNLTAEGSVSAEVLGQLGVTLANVTLSATSTESLTAQPNVHVLMRAGVDAVSMHANVKTITMRPPAAGVLLP